MSRFLTSKLGLCSIAAFVLVMLFAWARVSAGRTPPHLTTVGVAASAPELPAPSAPAPTTSAVSAATSSPALPSAPSSPKSAAATELSTLAEQGAYLEQYFKSDPRTEADRDPQGNQLTRRRNAHGLGDTASGGTAEANAPGAAIRASLRIQGRPATSAAQRISDAPRPPPSEAAPAPGARTAQQTMPARTTTVPAERRRPARFNPYGNVIKCELVFTVDSTNEQTPLVGLVMEPVYNNGALVIPAGAELHGVARPDRLRNRIFSGQDWVLVFPREQGRPNGRQLNVRGAALNRVEPQADGLTWGITDGSYGLEGQIIRNADREEIKRFAATFLAAAATTLQERESTGRRTDTVRNTPQNAVLQGLAANLEKAVERISAEIAEHGVFIRVPAGHQFYFYPMQLIDADAADISSDIATVK